MTVPWIGWPFKTIPVPRNEPSPHFIVLMTLPSIDWPCYTIPCFQNEQFCWRQHQCSCLSAPTFYLSHFDAIDDYTLNILALQYRSSSPQWTIPLASTSVQLYIGMGFDLIITQYQRQIKPSIYWPCSTVPCPRSESFHCRRRQCNLTRALIFFYSYPNTKDT